MTLWKSSPPIYLYLLLFGWISLSPLQAQSILQGKLIDASKVEFEVIDGLAFQNSIKIIVEGQVLGHFLGTGGTWASKLEKKVAQLQKAQGAFYLPVSSRSVRGLRVIDQIIHFPDHKKREQSLSDRCTHEMKELKAKARALEQGHQKLFERLHQLSHPQRVPAGVED